MCCLCFAAAAAAAPTVAAAAIAAFRFQVLHLRFCWLCFVSFSCRLCRLRTDIRVHFDRSHLFWRISILIQGNLGALQRLAPGVRIQNGAMKTFATNPTVRSVTCLLAVTLAHKRWRVAMANVQKAQQLAQADRRENCAGLGRKTNGRTSEWEKRISSASHWAPLLHFRHTSAH